MGPGRAKSIECSETATTSGDTHNVVDTDPGLGGPVGLSRVCGGEPVPDGPTLDYRLLRMRERTSGRGPIG